MIPLRDTQEVQNYPVVTHALIAVNALIFLMQLAAPGTDIGILYGLVPARYTNPEFSGYFSIGQQLFSFVSYMFLHGGWLHLIGNMWSLYIFGNNIEDHLGPVRFLGFYLACGVCSGLAHMLFNLSSPLPTIGASGAIAGVMGAYIILYPRSKVLTLFPIFFIPLFFEIPAYVFLGLWFLLQFVSAALTDSATTGIAWWAHVGGFLFGIIFLRLFEMLPATGLSQHLRRHTAKKTSSRLQMVKPRVSSEPYDLHGTISITPYEALTGTRKMVDIPFGFAKRMIRVIVPAGVKQDTKLRLKSLGKPKPDGERGNLYLKVNIGL